MANSSDSGSYLCKKFVVGLSKNIRSLSRQELESLFQEWGEPRFRAGQVHDWLWKNHVTRFEDMANLPKALRQKLDETFIIGEVRIDGAFESKDGTVKYAFRLAGGQEVEGVLIPSGKRLTACISSQAGCSLDCKFCATGLLDLKHNLHHFEIYDQVRLINDEAIRRHGRPLTHIVYMGMGEPLLNYRHVLASIGMLTSPEGLGMSPRRITVSTSGIAKMIRKLGDDQIKFEFAVSLHAANDEKRSKIMSINDSNNLETLKEALQYFYEKTRTRVTYEYIIFRDFNDTVQDALELVAFSRHVPSKINIIEYNPVPELGLENTTPARMKAFIDTLEKHGLIVNVRRSRGRDVDGACGQLALRHQPATS
jgi:23S rRNA (adenine2503-C2)-methyltransferase